MDVLIRGAVVAAVAALAAGQSLAQGPLPNRDSWVAKENAATQAAQLQVEAARIAAAEKSCAKAAVYWEKRHIPFDVDQCLANPAAAQDKMIADENAQRQAEYREQQARYAQQQAEYQAQLAEYKRRLAESNQQNPPSEKPGPPE